MLSCLNRRGKHRRCDHDRDEVPNFTDANSGGISADLLVAQHFPQHDLVDSHVDHDRQTGQHQRPTVLQQRGGTGDLGLPGTHPVAACAIDDQQTCSDQRRLGKTRPDKGHQGRPPGDHRQLDASQHQEGPVFDPDTVARLHLRFEPEFHDLTELAQHAQAKNSHHAQGERIIWPQPADNAEHQSHGDRACQQQQNHGCSQGSVGSGGFPHKVTHHDAIKAQAGGDAE